MEDTKAEMRLGELKRETLRKSLEERRAQASSMLALSVKWNELETQLRLVQNKIEQRAQVLELQEKQVETNKRLLMEKENEFSLKENDLWSLLQLISQCCENLERKDKELGFTKEPVDHVETRRLDDKFSASKFKELENSIKEFCYKLDLKQCELVKIQQVIEEQSKQLVQNEGIISSNRVLIEEYNEELEAKEQLYNVLSKSVTDHAAELESKEKDLGLIEKKMENSNAKLDSIEEKIQSKEQKLNAELLLKEKQLSSFQNSIVECSKQLKFEEGQLTLIKNTILECNKELVLKQQHLEALQKSREQLSVELESKQKLVDSNEKACIARLLEADNKEKHLDLLKTSLEDGFEKLETEKKQFQAHIKEFEVKQKQFHHVQKAVEQKTKELELKEKQSTNALNHMSNIQTVNPIIPNQIKTEQQAHGMGSNTNETAMDRRSLQSIGVQPVEMSYLRQNEVLNAIRMPQYPVLEQNRNWQFCATDPAPPVHWTNSNTNPPPVFQNQAIVPPVQGWVSASSYGNQATVPTVQGSIYSYGNQATAVQGSVYSYGNQATVPTVQGSVYSYGTQAPKVQGIVYSYGNQAIAPAVQGSASGYESELIGQISKRARTDGPAIGF